jgi:hypothetical protein
MKSATATNKGAIVFVVGGGTSHEVMRIDASGNIGIGTCRMEPEPLTEWYKAAVKQKKLTPHTKETDGN